MKRRPLLRILAASLAAVAAPSLHRATAAATPPSYLTVAVGQVLRGRFTEERVLSGFARPLASSGDFVLAPGSGLIWRTAQPFAIVTIITAAGLVQEVDGTETTHLSAAQLPFIARLYGLLSDALAGDRHALDMRFQATRHDDAGQWELTLVPRDGTDPQAMPFRSITLHGGAFLDQVRIDRLDGDSDRLAFSGQTLGTGLSDAEGVLLRQAAQ